MAQSEQERTKAGKAAMLTALESTLGIVTSACKKTSVSRSIYYEWLKEDEDFAVAVKDISEIAKDFVESKLHQEIEALSVPATIFYLKTKARDRGYQENMDITSQGEKVQAPIILFGDVDERDYMDDQPSEEDSKED